MVFITTPYQSKFTGVIQHVWYRDWLTELHPHPSFSSPPVFPCVTAFFPNVWLQRTYITVRSCVMNHHSADSVALGPHVMSHKRPLMYIFTLISLNDVSNFAIKELWKNWEELNVLSFLKPWFLSSSFAAWLMSVPPTQNFTSIASHKASDWLSVVYVIISVM